MRLILTLIAVLALATVGAAVYFRLVPMDPETWHVDPRTATPPASPNYALRTGETAARFDLPPDVVAARLDAAATADGADILAGRPADGFVTYVARSRLMGYPDAISVRIESDAEGTTVDIFSRSRFGYSDMGVNEARVARWLATVGAGAAGP
jgi:uncharacterized protein (DUF1499 family)